MINNIPKRHFYNNRDYILDFNKKTLILSKDFHEKLKNKNLWNKFGFKKIGGSSVGDVLEIDNYKSQFAAFCRMAWCGLPILDKKYVNAGVAIESKVIGALEEVMKTKVVTFPPEKYNFDYFEKEDDVIGGIPDGFLPNEKIILEIKTTSEKNYQNWEKFGLPAAYLKQAQIYTYLMKVEKFWIVATFLKDDDYNNPQEYPIRERIIKNYKYVINKEQIEDDIKKIKDWYYKHTESGESPAWDETRDADLLEYLKCSSQEEYIELLEKWKSEGKFIDE